MGQPADTGRSGTGSCSCTGVLWWAGWAFGRQSKIERGPPLVPQLLSKAVALRRRALGPVTRRKLANISDHDSELDGACSSLCRGREVSVGEATLPVGLRGS